MSLTARLSVAAVGCMYCCAAIPGGATARPWSEVRSMRAASVPKSVVQLMPRSTLSFDAWSIKRDTYAHDYV